MRFLRPLVHAEMIDTIGIFFQDASARPELTSDRSSQWAIMGEMAEREGFEPSVRFHVHTRSRRAP
jgi:hypothetical protein